jgi:hypothetical protein
MSQASDLIKNWVHYYRTLYDAGSPLYDLGYGRDTLDIAGAMTGVKDGEREEVKRPTIKPNEPLALLVQAVYEKRPAMARVVLIRWFFKEERYGRAPSVVVNFQQDVGKIRI